MDYRSRLGKRKIPKAVVFTEQLRRLVSQGVPEVEAVEALLKDMPGGRFKEVVRTVYHRLKSGRSLSAALSGLRRYFPEGYVSIVEAGEKSGNLPRALELASAYVARRDVSRQRIFLGILLPLITVAVCFGVMRFFQDLILPPLVEMLAGSPYEQPMPVAAPRLMHLFDTAIVVFACLAIPLLSLFFALFYYPAAKSVVLCRLCNVLEICLKGGLPLEECHRLARKVSWGRSFRRAVDGLFRKVSSGESVGNAFAAIPYFRGELSWMVAAGERRGDIPGALSDAADFHNVRADTKLSLLFNVAPPVITVVIAIPVAILAVSVFGFLRWTLDVTYRLLY